MLTNDDKTIEQAASSSRSQPSDIGGGDDETEESKENQIVSSQSEELKVQRKEKESEEITKKSSKDHDDDKRPLHAPSTTTPTEDDDEERKSLEESLSKHHGLRSESTASEEEESKKTFSKTHKNNSSSTTTTTTTTTTNNLTLEEFTDIVLASEGFEHRRGNSSVRVKPVVLAPRTNGNYAHQTVTSSASVVVSVKPRIQRRVPPPSGRQPSGSSLVEEWFRKMKPPILKEEAEEELSAMNLSLKKSKPITLRPNKGASLTISSSPHPASSYPKTPLSPPRLELRKMPSPQEKALSGRRYYPYVPAKKRSSYNKPSPQTDLVYSDMMDAIKDRAVRDLHLAHTKDMHGNFPIHMSVLMRKPSLVRRYCCVLHILNSNVDLTNEDKYTALHLAVLDNSVEIVELLLSFGADPSIKDHRGNTCFHQAVATKSNDCLKLLVEHLRTKEDLDSFNDSGFTALQIAIKKNDPASVHTLIQSGANLNIPENYKTTASHCHLTPKNEHNKIISERYLSLSRLH